MKHTFSRFLSAGLVLGALMAIISCSNVLGASLKDPLGSSADSGKMPVLYVTASVGSSSRTILPSDWTEERASALVYQITDDDDGDAVIADELTYAELKAGLTLYLEVKAWNLTLTGYEKTGAAADSTKPVLSAKATADLSAGATAITFDLKPADVTLAQGDADVSVTFYDIDELDHITYGLFDDSNAGAGQVDVETATKNTGSWTGVAGVSESNSTTNQWKITYTTDTADAGGDSFFGVIFYNAGNADNMDVTAVWQKALTVNVTFPSYAEAQSVQLLDTYSEAAVITKPKTEPSVEVTAATPATGGTLNNVVYIVYNIDGTTPVTAGVDDDGAGKLTWTFANTTGLTAGVYRIYVTADYTGTDTTVTPLSGNLYIKITE